MYANEDEQDPVADALEKETSMTPLLHRPDHSSMRWQPKSGTLVHLDNDAINRMADVCISRDCRREQCHRIVNFPGIVVITAPHSLSGYYVCRTCHRAWWCSWNRAWIIDGST